MKLGVMQPYFFPYPGYFQLISHCDSFVFYDDVQFIKGGWINRNRILCNDQPKWLTYPIKSGSTFANICERSYVADRIVKSNLLNQIENSYRDAAFFGNTLELFRSILDYQDINVAKFNINLIETVSDYIGLKTNFLAASDLNIDKNIKGQARVLEACRLTKSKIYVNSIGGIDLYQKDKFDDKGVKLQYIKPETFRYSQRKNEFVPMLSILDFLMFCPVATIREVLETYYSIIE